MGKHYVGEVGTDLLLDTGIDISGASVAEIRWRDGAGASTGQFTGSLFSSFSKITGLVGTNFVKYTLARGDLDVAGTWRFQAYIVTAAGTWWGEMVEEPVFNELE